MKVTRDDGEEFSFTARCRIDTYNELEYFRSGGILQYVLRRLAASVSALVGTCHCGRVQITLPRKPDEVTHCNCSLCTQDRLPGHLFLVRGAADREARLDSYVRADSNPAYIAQHRCRHCGIVTHWTPLTDPPHERMGVNARLFEPGSLDGSRGASKSTGGAGRHDADQIAVEVVGWAGAVLILLAYLLLSAGKLTGQSPLYQWMNIVGAAGFVDQRLVARRLPSTALNVVWMLIGGVALWQIVEKRGSSTSAM